ncbi:MAG: murein biosynthesis integral membrane protein MurJ, partial [Clostridia bacterium]|nr:murein biosynthesis integral membrane protein MurJ [Clostridia bacterium]
VMVAFIMLMGQCMFAAILNARKLFVRVQIGSILFNVVVIGGIFVFGKTQDVAILTWATVIGHTIQNIFLFIFAKKRFKFSVPKKLFDSDIKRMIKLAVPILLGNSVYQINNIVDKNLASNLGEGAVSALSYSGTLNLLVVAVFITSLTTVLYPTLTRNAAEGNSEEYSSNLLNSISMIGIVIIPISIIAFMFSDDIVRIVYERGQFNPEATRLTSAALKYYALGFVFTGIREMMVRGFYARENSKTPMINGIIAVAANIVSSILLSRVMGIAGIALGTAISSLIASALLIVSMRRDLESVKLSTKKHSIIAMIVSGIVSVGVLIGVDGLLVSFETIGTLGALIRFAAAVLLGGGAYLVSLILMKCEEIKMLLVYIKNILSKFKGKKAQ